MGCRIRRGHPLASQTSVPAPRSLLGQRLGWAGQSRIVRGEVDRSVLLGVEGPGLQLLGVGEGTSTSGSQWTHGLWGAVSVTILSDIKYSSGVKEGVGKQEGEDQRPTDSSEDGSAQGPRAPAWGN